MGGSSLLLTPFQGKQVVRGTATHGQLVTNLSDQLGGGVLQGLRLLALEPGLELHHLLFAHEAQGQQGGPDHDYDHDYEYEIQGILHWAG